MRPLARRTGCIRTRRTLREGIDAVNVPGIREFEAVREAEILEEIRRRPGPEPFGA
jgi:hypothetical protein